MPSLPPVAASPRPPFNAAAVIAAAMTEERQRERAARRAAGTICSWPLAKPTATTSFARSSASAVGTVSTVAARGVTGLPGNRHDFSIAAALRDELRAVRRQLRSRHGHRAREPQPIELGAGRDVEHGDGAVVAREREPPPVGRRADASRPTTVRPSGRPSSALANASGHDAIAPARSTVTSTAPSFECSSRSTACACGKRLSSAPRRVSSTRTTVSGPCSAT